MVINFHKDFIKDSSRLTSSQKDKLTQRLKLFELDGFDPVLNNHSLRGKYSGYRSINITGDLRAIFKKSGIEVMFMEINSHSNLYG